MADKRMSAEQVAAALAPGMTIGVGGWGSRRKPMALIRALLRAGHDRLEVVSYAGPDVGLLCAYGRAASVTYGFASLDSIPLEPQFRRARQSGAIRAVEYDEGMLWLGLQAAAWRLPFLPTRAGLGSDVMRVNPHLRTVTSPYADGEALVAVPAIQLDAALIHVHRADARGNCQVLGPDPYFDDLFAGAASRVYVSAERIVPTSELLAEGPLQSLILDRSQVAGVVEAPGGAAFTSCDPDYPRDEALQRLYAAGAKDPAAWDQFCERFFQDGGRP